MSEPDLTDALFREAMLRAEKAVCPPAKLFGHRGGHRIRASDYEAFLKAWPDADVIASLDAIAAFAANRSVIESQRRPATADLRNAVIAAS